MSSITAKAYGTVKGTNAPGNIIAPKKGAQGIPIKIININDHSQKQDIPFAGISSQLETTYINENIIRSLDCVIETVTTMEEKLTAFRKGHHTVPFEDGVPLRYVKNILIAIDGDEILLGPIYLVSKDNTLIVFGRDFLKKVKGELIVEFDRNIGWVKSTWNDQQLLTEYAGTQNALTYTNSSGLIKSIDCVSRNDFFDSNDIIFGTNFFSCYHCKNIFMSIKYCICRKAKYCGKDCQTADYKNHKSVCTYSSKNKNK